MNNNKKKEGIKGEKIDERKKEVKENTGWIDTEENKVCIIGKRWKIN